MGICNSSKNTRKINEIHNINQHKNNYNNNENKTIENENLDLDFPLLNSKKKNKIILLIYRW
jgi:hypothetical protein